ncbi:unnamed protein product [Trypanosoma congolense IL3000]|nr:unnamed protein product [Trypanosoma congolense IL3000]
MELVSALGLFGASPVSAALASVLPPFRESLASNLLQLVRALRATPEDDNIRRVRCGNLRVMAEYGHAGFCSACPTCQSVVSAAEVLWYMLGYRVEYTSVPAANLPAVVQGNPDLCLPCKRLALNHTFVPVGFEDYSERLFTLREPDPSEAPGEWMGWYSRLEDIMHGLEMIVA